MKTLSFSESYARYAEMLAAVTDDREGIVITRPGRAPVVVVALDEYESLKQTVFLARRPARKLAE